uniref:Uncharacterized protein n=1 Tax=Anguilla anguilla TaxID=7936 RepID=A0A0E9PBM3_ANGAN
MCTSISRSYLQNRWRDMDLLQ